jgi:hypothetical protein
VTYQQGATYPFECPACGATAHYELAGWLDGVRISWCSEVHCTGCGPGEQVLHGTSVGVADFALLRAQGGWFGLFVEVPDPDRVRLVKELRAALRLPLAEAARMLSARTGPLATGLELEMRRVEALVLRSLPDAVTTVSRIGG